jgi:uncharacterized protein YjiS (DUF1127 family)
MTIGIATKLSAGLFAAIAHAVATAALRAWRCAVALKHRHELHRLLDCEDRMLADIGISRDDLRAALSEPLWRDPTTALAARAGRPVAQARPDFRTHVHAHVRAGLPVRPGVRHRAHFRPHGRNGLEALPRTPQHRAILE